MHALLDAKLVRQRFQRGFLRTFARQIEIALGQLRQHAYCKADILLLVQAPQRAEHGTLALHAEAAAQTLPVGAIVGKGRIAVINEGQLFPVGRRIVLERVRNRLADDDIAIIEGRGAEPSLDIADDRILVARGIALRGDQPAAGLSSCHQRADHIGHGLEADDHIRTASADFSADTLLERPPFVRQLGRLWRDDEEIIHAVAGIRFALEQEA
ncbi:hypothetical protein D3C87_1433040 [compost metagenome]